MTTEKVTLNGTTYDLDVVVNLMDDGLREELHTLAFDTEQSFVDAYVRSHLAKFEEEFSV